MERHPEMATPNVPLSLLMATRLLGGLLAGAMGCWESGGFILFRVQAPLPGIQKEPS